MSSLTFVLWKIWGFVVVAWAWSLATASYWLQKLPPDGLTIGGVRITWPQAKLFGTLAFLAFLWLRRRYIVAFFSWTPVRALCFLPNLVFLACLGAGLGDMYLHNPACGLLIGAIAAASVYEYCRNQEANGLYQFPVGCIFAIGFFLFAYVGALVGTLFGLQIIGGCIGALIFHSQINGGEPAPLPRPLPDPFGNGVGDNADLETLRQKGHVGTNNNKKEGNFLWRKLLRLLSLR